MKIHLAAILALLALGSRLSAAAPESLQPPKSQPPGGNIESLVRELGDESFRVREKATREIWELGESALPALIEAAESSSPEQAFRARELVRKIQLHITPQTDPSVTALVERYVKASPSEKAALLGRMKAKRAWRQMLKLYAAESQPEIREKLAQPMNGIAVRAARERLLRGDADGAREFLEMAPAGAEGLLALAEFHRSNGSLPDELERIKDAEGPKAAAWRLALERAAGNLIAARTAAAAAGEPRIAAAMAALAGDPLPWLQTAGQNPFGSELDVVAAAYSQAAARRWLGEKIRSSDLEPLTKALGSRSIRQSGTAMNALFLLGEREKAEENFAKAEPLEAFGYFESLERVPEALKALGLDPDTPDYQTWVAQRFAALDAEEIENQHAVLHTGDEIIALANFLERKGLHPQAYDAFSRSFAALAEKDQQRFLDLLRQLFGNNELSANSEASNGAPLLAKRIGIEWAGNDATRWDDLLVAAFGDEDQANAWWNWLPTLDPKPSRSERFDAMLALHGMGPDPMRLRERWLDLAWKAVDEPNGQDRAILTERIYWLVTRTGDVANSLKAWENLPDQARKEAFWGQRVVYLSALDHWDDAAAVILQQMAVLKDADQEPGPELHAYAAAALRRAGHEDEAVLHDTWADKLALGNPSLAMRIGNGYAYGGDYTRAGEWWARAAREADPDSGEFAVAAKFHADELLEKGDWKQAAAVSEMLVRIYADSDFRWANPLPYVRQRLQADTARALANLETHRAESIALLEQCHRDYASDGSLADFFFPALRKVGLLKEHDRWFQETWQLMEAMIHKYPECENTRNTAAWFASRSCLQLDAAENYLTGALAMSPNQPAYLDTMAEIQFARGKRDKALEWSKRAINFAPDDSQLRRQHERFRNAPLPTP